MSHKCPIINNKRCPESASRDGGCPAWVEGVLEANPHGEQRVVNDCILRLLPRWLLQGYADSEKVRGEIHANREALNDLMVTFGQSMANNGLDGAINIELVEPKLVNQESEDA